MKKLVVIISAVCMAHGHAIIAQKQVNVAEKPAVDNPKKHHMPPEQRAEKIVKKMDEIAQLSADQKTKVYDLALNKAKLIDAVFEKYKGQPDKKEQAKQEIHQIRKEFREEVKKILTPEQIEKLKQHHQANKAKEKGLDRKNENIIPDEGIEK